MQFTIQKIDEQLHIRRGGGWFALLGLPFVFAGLLLLVVCLGALFLANWKSLILLIFAGSLGLVFLAVGSIQAFDRAGTIIDCGRGTVTSWRRFLGLGNSRHFALSDFDALILTRYWNESRMGPDWLFRISLRARNPHAPAIEIGSSFAESTARAHLANLAERLAFPIVERRPLVTACNVRNLT